MRSLLVAVALCLSSSAWAQGVNEGAPRGATVPAPDVARAPADQPIQGDPAHGGQLFAAVGCYQCHGYVGQGSTRTGPSLAPNVIPLSAFTAQLRHPMDRMPPYTEAVLPAPDVADIYAYLQSLPKPPDPKSIALLNN